MNLVCLGKHLETEGSQVTCVEGRVVELLIVNQGSKLKAKQMHTEVIWLISCWGPIHNSSFNLSLVPGTRDMSHAYSDSFSDSVGRVRKVFGQKNFRSKCANKARKIRRACTDRKRC